MPDTRQSCVVHINFTCLCSNKQQILEEERGQLALSRNRNITITTWCCWEGTRYLLIWDWYSSNMIGSILFHRITIPQQRDLLTHFSSSTFNTCPDQPLTDMTSPDIKLYLDPSAKLKAFPNSPNFRKSDFSFPLHWLPLKSPWTPPFNPTIT